jgi:hypothetical protein
MSRAPVETVWAILLFGALLDVQQPQVLWEPPTIPVGPVAPEPTVARDLVPSLDVGPFKVILEDTSLAQAGAYFKAPVGHAGDASESISWVCLHGHDSAGRWALWLESGEIHGGLCGGFFWQRLSAGDRLDERCGAVETPSVSLPVRLRLGASVADVLRHLGPPTSQSAERMLYVHRRAMTLVPKGGGPPQPYELWSTLYMRLRRGTVDAIQAWHTTSS